LKNFNFGGLRNKPSNKEQQNTVVQDMFQWHVSLNMALNNISGFHHGAVDVFPLLGQAVQFFPFTA